MQTIRIYGTDGWRDAACLEERGGLAVVRLPNGAYTVTHRFSGLAVGSSYGLAHMASAAMHAAMTMPVDWTQPDEVVKESLDAAGRKELHRRMRLAATPPRRARYWASCQHKRHRNAHAELKRTAIRENAKCGRIGWSYFFTWHWLEGWGGIIPPVRQRCKRFITVPKAGLVRRLARRNRLPQCAVYQPQGVEDRMAGVVWVDGRLSSRWPRA